MKYTYAYKTSDGVRHEDEITANSREEVFEALRSRGIKAIKVVAADGSKANGEPSVQGRKRMALVALLLGLAIGAVAVYFAQPEKPGGGSTQAPPVREVSDIQFTSDESRANYIKLRDDAQKLVDEHNERMRAIGLQVLSDYGKIEKSQDLDFFKEKIMSAYRAIDSSRIKVRELFRSIFDVFPPDCIVERNESQRLYAETMDAIDVTESQLANQEKAFLLLSANRSGWHTVQSGEIEFTNESLAREFKYFRRDIGVDNTRFLKDFGAIESTAVEQPKE